MKAGAMALRRAVAWRVAPFAVFMVLLALRGEWPAELPVDARWVYAVTVVVVGGLLWAGRRHYQELGRSQQASLREWVMAVAVGLAVFVAWIHLDAVWMRLGEPSAAFLPLNAQGELAWGWVAVRVLGAAAVVPLMEELFWRSLLMRWIDRPNFLAQAPRDVSGKALVLSTFVFTLAHTLWLAAIVAGLAYALLYRQTGKLWPAVIAHAVTNAALAVWVVAGGHWAYW